MSALEAMWPALTIFPLRLILPGPACDCGAGALCKSIGKHPAVLWSDLAPAEKIASANAGSGYGIATGARSGVFVVDLDGAAAIDAFEAMGPCPDTFTVVRGLERAHLYFRHPGFAIRNSASALGPGIDIRGDGGYVVAPGSPHKSGERYEIFADFAPADAPAWLLTWLRRRARPSAPRHDPTAPTTSVPRDWRIERARAWLATRPPAIEGNGGDKHTWKTLLTAVKAFLLTDVEMTMLAFEDWNARCDPPWDGAQWERNIENAIESGHVPWSTSLELHYELERGGAFR